MPPLRDLSPSTPRPSALERYAHEFAGVEINTTFYRHHRPSTFERWRASVPPGFQFSVKVPRLLTHDARLGFGPDQQETLERFLAEIAGLGRDALGPLLVQLPPSLGFDAPVAARWFDELRARWDGHVVCEPRHPSWFEPEAEALLVEMRVARVAADPSKVVAATSPGGWLGVAYFRLHGSPRMYYSRYEDTALDELATRVRCLSAHPREVWIVFDNTASGAAIDNARTLAQLAGNVAH